MLSLITRSLRAAVRSAPVQVSTQHRRLQHSGEVQPAQRTLLSLRPSQFVEFLRSRKIQRCFAIWNGESVVTSHPEIQELADWMNTGRERQFRRHEALFMQLGLRTGCLLTAFLWRTDRGQAVSCLPRLLSKTKPILPERDVKHASVLNVAALTSGRKLGNNFNNFGWFVLRRHTYRSHADLCCYEVLHAGYFQNSHNKVSGLPCNSSGTTYFRSTSRGHSGNSFKGVLKVIFLFNQVVAWRSTPREFIRTTNSLGQSCVYLHAPALTHTQKTGSSNKREAVDWTGEHVAPTTLPCLFLSLSCVTAKSPLPLQILSPQTIPSLGAQVVCGPVNEQRVSDDDCQLLQDHGVLYVPEYLFNRMAVVNSAYEWYGRLQEDPELEKHFGNSWEHSIGVMVRRVLCQASEQGQSPVPVADALAEGLSRQLHPLWPGRARQVISALVTHGWHRGHDFWRDRLHFVTTHGYA
ncbi:unnamed protein product [Ixodes persulcatus]